MHKTLMTRWRVPALLAGVVVAGLLPMANGLAAGGDPFERMSGIEAQATALSLQVGDLQAGLNQLGGKAGNEPASEGPVIRVAQSRDVASLAVRMDNVDQQIRTLTGQIQGLQFQMTQLQALIQKMQDDNEFRFKQLEDKTSGKKTDAAPRTGSVTPTGGASPLSNKSRAAANAGASDLTPPGGADVSTTIANVPPGGRGAPPHPLGTLPASDLQGLDAGTLGAGALGGDNLGTDNSGGNLGYDPNAQTSAADAEAQYKAGYDAVVRGDYAFAEDQFRQFIALYPNDPKAPDAVNWLGEALIQRGTFGDAANVLFSGFQKYKDTARGPDILLRLGIALNGTDQADSRDTACRTFLEVLRRYDTLTPAFKKKVSEAQRKAQC